MSEITYRESPNTATRPGSGHIGQFAKQSLGPGQVRGSQNQQDGSPSGKVRKPPAGFPEGFFPPRHIRVTLA